MIGDQSLTELVMQAQVGNVDAFEQLFRTYERKIDTYLARLVSQHDQWRDLAQQTFLQVWEKLPTLRNPQQFKPWLYRIATNEAMSFLRREERWSRSCQSLPDDEEHIPDVFPNAPGPEERVAEEDWLKQALRALEPQ